ncbi:response regulator [Chitinimonas sp. BJB300]|uniref:response regulator n=1 Tax=Chitinimonas sp. BJB300 TaxID=1559339 RepID=UPI000C0EC106|nr:response regulator [Chitinimonas sp. BJB300]PHV11247.1 response regulator [Chitinimonas sp. BJB300]TSJ88607.1 response regulator [Chitinimonas sp. BJB300]
MNELPRALLLVDDEANVLSSLSRLFRTDGYQILRASSGPEGLEILAKQPVSVVISDQRMPGMTGVEFLRKVRENHPKTVRIVLSGYTDLKSVTDAINEGAIYKFLTKPWDDAELRALVAESFIFFETVAYNEQQTADLIRSAQLASQHLEEVVSHAKSTEKLTMAILMMSQEVVELLPLPLLGVSLEGDIVLANMASISGFGPCATLGNAARDCLPPEILGVLSDGMAPGDSRYVSVGGPANILRTYYIARLGRWSPAGGYLLIAEEAQKWSPLG